MNVRPFQTSDGPRIREIISTVFHEYGMTFDPEGWDWDVARPEEKFFKPGHALWVAEDSGKVLGLIGAHEESDFVEVHRLYIDPAARGRGLGSLLFKQVEGWAQEGSRAETCRRIVLYSDVRFTHAHTFYRRCGFQITGIRNIGDLDRSVEYEMQLPPPSLTLAAPRWVNLAQARKDSALGHRLLMATCAVVDHRIPQKRAPLPLPESLFKNEGNSEVEVLLTAHQPAIPIAFRCGSQEIRVPGYSD